MNYQFAPERVEAGCDEAGRGCLAGPVYAAAVILDPAKPIPGLRDSKLLSPSKREALRTIIEKRALGWAVAFADVAEIDRHNIANASYRAMHKALKKLRQTFDLILVDGNRFIQYQNVPHQCVIGGDDLIASISAASILAKTHRDQHMIRLSEGFPHYGWDQNKGYPTLYHREAIWSRGLTKHHRRTFTAAYRNTLFQ
jgi:ribonuclease HII